MNARQYQINFEIITVPLYAAEAGNDELTDFKTAFDALICDVTQSLSYGYAQTLSTLWLPDLLDVNVADENINILTQAADHIISSMSLDNRLRFDGPERAKHALDAGFYAYADYLAAKGYVDIHQCADATLYSVPQVQEILHNAHLRHVATLLPSGPSVRSESKDANLGQFSI